MVEHDTNPAALLAQQIRQQAASSPIGTVAAPPMADTAMQADLERLRDILDSLDDVDRRLKHVVQALDMFMSLSRQWQDSGSGAPFGFDIHADSHSGASSTPSPSRTRDQLATMLARLVKFGLEDK
jgi:hypothetical protein